MDMEKNLEWLNSKWWYRLLKVVYVFTFLLVTGLLIGGAFDELSPYQTLDLENSTFTCLTGNTEEFTYRNLLPTEELSSLKRGSVKYTTIATFCELDNAFGDKVTDNNFSNFRNYIDRPDYQEKMDAWHERLEDSFLLKPIQKTEGSWWHVVFASLASIIGVFLVLEVIKRTFYYIILGKIRPRN